MLVAHMGRLLENLKAIHWEMLLVHDLELRGALMMEYQLGM